MKKWFILSIIVGFIVFMVSYTALSSPAVSIEELESTERAEQKIYEDRYRELSKREQKKHMEIKNGK